MHNIVNKLVKEDCFETVSIKQVRTKIAIEPIECNRTQSNNCGSIVERNGISIE